MVRSSYLRRPSTATQDDRAYWRAASGCAHCKVRIDAGTNSNGWPPTRAAQCDDPAQPRATDSRSHHSEAFTCAISEKRPVKRLRRWQPDDGLSAPPQDVVDLKARRCSHRHVRQGLWNGRRCCARSRPDKEQRLARTAVGLAHLKHTCSRFDAITADMTHSTLAGIRELCAQHDPNANVQMPLGSARIWAHWIFATCALPMPTTGLEVKFRVAHAGRDGRPRRVDHDHRRRRGR